MEQTAPEALLGPQVTLGPTEQRRDVAVSINAMVCVCVCVCRLYLSQKCVLGAVHSVRSTIGRANA